MNKETEAPRRSFLKWLMGLGIFGWLGSIFYPIARFLVPPRIPEAKITSINVGKIDDFKVETGTIFQFGREPGILIHLENGEFKALTATCTHLSCIVQYRSDFKHIWCACHNGHYDLNGKNIAGPPPRPLEQFDVDFDEKGNVWVSRKT